MRSQHVGWVLFVVSGLAITASACSTAETESPNGAEPGGDTPTVDGTPAEDEDASMPGPDMGKKDAGTPGAKPAPKPTN